MPPKPHPRDRGATRRCRHRFREVQSLGHLLGVPRTGARACFWAPKRGGKGNPHPEPSEPHLSACGIAHSGACFLCGKLCGPPNVCRSRIFRRLLAAACAALNKKHPALTNFTLHLRHSTRPLTFVPRPLRLRTAPQRQTPSQALDAAEQYVNGEVSDEELEAAWNAAGSASINAGCYCAAHAAAKSAEYAASPGAAWAAELAAEAAFAAVGYARAERWGSEGSEWVPRGRALRTIVTTWGAKADACAAARNAEQVAQTLKFIEICDGNDV